MVDEPSTAPVGVVVAVEVGGLDQGRCARRLALVAAPRMVAQMTPSLRSVTTPVREATILTDRFTTAVDCARVIHAGQKRKGSTTPYLAHVIAVAAIVLEHGGSEDQAIAALLHDAAEDGGGLEVLNDIRNRFGPHVADLVEACSDSLVADRDQKESWWIRKVRYIRRLEDEPADAALISAPTNSTTRAPC